MEKNKGEGFIPIHGGYRNLITFRKAEIIYDGTVYFTKRFFRLTYYGVPPSDAQGVGLYAASPRWGCGLSASIPHAAMLKAFVLKQFP